MAYIQDWGMRVQAQPQINTTRRAFLHLSQNENGRMLNIRITDVNIPAGSTAVLAGTKPDGTVYSQAGTLAGNTATFAEDVQMTAVAGTWDAKITVTNGGNCICTARITITIDPDTIAGGAIPSDSQLDGIIAECRAIADSVRKEAYGSPLVADAVEDMTDQSRVYVYTGSETGYTSGHWYYYNGTAWSDGGVYNSIAVDTDTTLTIAGKAADAKATGDAVAELKEDFNAMRMATAGDVGKALKVKTVTNGQVTEWEFGEAGGSESVTDTVTGESVTFVTSETSPRALSVTVESTIPDTSGATPTNPISITGITSETFTVNGTDKVVNLTNPIGKGTWNVLTGEVADERPVIDFTSELVHSLAKASDDFYAILIKLSNAGFTVNPNGILACTHYPVYKSGAINYPVIRYVNGTYYLYDTNITENNLQAAKEYIANLGAKLVLDVTDPVTYTETPETVTLVNGENTVAVSTGEMSLTYAVDVKGYVDGKVASVEDTANEALETANGLDARVTANTELSESNEQEVYKFRTYTESYTGTGSATTSSTTRWGFHLDIDESIEKCYSITFTPQFPSTVTGEYTATRWKKGSGTLATGDILTKVDEVTKAVGEPITFDDLGINEFVSLNKSCQRTTDVNGNVRIGYINETTGAYTSFSGYLSGDFEITFCKPAKDDSMPLYGIKMALVGDSITEHNGRANTNHAMYLNQWTGAVVQNLGVGGTGFSTNNKYKDRIANIKADTEIIGVAASLNDMSNTVGTASDTASDETVCGYANEFFDLLLASFPSVPIVCYSEGPWNTYHPGIVKSDSFMEQMKQICLNKGIAWDDGLYRGCALRPWIQANREALYKGEWGSYTDVVDDIHPNSAGQRYIAIYLKELFEKYVRD